MNLSSENYVVWYKIKLNIAREHIQKHTLYML
jgi:hypothetical protein